MGLGRPLKPDFTWLAGNAPLLPGWSRRLAAVPESVLLGAVFYLLGLGRIGTMGFTEGLVVAAAVLALLGAASALWMRGFVCWRVGWLQRHWRNRERVRIRRVASPPPGRRPSHF
jgi:hypothetical protein